MDRGTSARPAVLTPPYAPWAVLVGQGLSPGRRPVLPGAAGSSTILYREGTGRVPVMIRSGPQRPIAYRVTASSSIGSSTKIVYFLGLPRPAASGST